MPKPIAERCWNNIMSDTKSKESWDNKAGKGPKNTNRSYLLLLTPLIALIIVVIVSFPILLNDSKSFLKNIASFNREDTKEVQDNNPEDVQNESEINKEEPVKEIPQQNDTDKRPEYTEKDENYLKALEMVRAIAKEKYKSFSLYSTGKAVKDYTDKKEYYVIGIYENAVGAKMPSEPEFIKVNKNTLKIVSYIDGHEIEEYYDTKMETDNISLSDEMITLLINKADNLNIEGYDVYGDIGLYVNIKAFSQEEINPKIPDDAYYYPKQKDIYYTYNHEESKLFKHSTINNEAQLLYTLKKDEFSILTEEKKADMDGDGKADTIKYDILRKVLSINGKSIVANNGWQFAGFDIVDIYNKDNQKEICITDVYPTTGKMTQLYCYKDGVISYVGGEWGEMGLDESGTVTFKNVIVQYFQTHFKDYEYQYYKDNILRLVKKDIYEQKNINASGEAQDIKMKKELKIYKNRISKEVSAVLTVGEKIKLIGDDNNDWILVENSQGIRGWIEIDYFNVKELNMHTDEVFEGLNFAG